MIADSPKRVDFAFEPPKGDEPGLLHHWSMKPIELDDGELRAQDLAKTSAPLHAWMGGTNIPGHGCESHLLDQAVSEPITVLGNHASGGAPAGKLAEVRAWSQPLTDEVIKVNSMIHLTGNEPELEAHYPLDDIIGAQAEARDQTGNHGPASIEAATPVARTAPIGRVGAQVTEFDGSDSTIVVPGADFGRSHTIEFLAKRAGRDRSDHLVLRSTTGAEVDLHLGYDVDNRLRLGPWVDSMSVDVGSRGVNEWIHVALVYDRDNDTRTAYLDGRRIGRQANAARAGAATETDDSVLVMDVVLHGGESRRSANGRHTLTQQADGDLVLTTQGKGQVWSTGSGGNVRGRLLLQGDGNLVIYTDGGPVWASHTGGTGAGHRLVVQNDGDVVVKNGDQVMWRSETVEAAPPASFAGQLAEFRVWDHARSAEQVRGGLATRAVGQERGLVNCLGFDASPITDRTGAAAPTVNGWVRQLRSDDLPIAPGPGVVTAEYNTVGPDPLQPSRRRAVLRRFFGYADEGGQVALLPGKPIEELVLKWIGNAQFEPTLLGYMEGAPPVPSENLTVNYDYDSATSVELIQSDETVYSWNRNRDVGGGLDANFFLGAGWSVSGGAFIQSKIAEGHLGARGSVNSNWRRSESSTIRLSSTEEYRDRLDLRGSYETRPRFPHLGNRFVPKNVGYALVVSGMADVFITQMRRTGRMVAYEVLPVEDVPPDINTITFVMNPTYTLNGSLDGLVGSKAADPRFYEHVPEMRSQYGSRYPASYFDLTQAYDLKSQIDRWDKQRESYFVNFDARETGLSDSALDAVPEDSESDQFGQVTVDDGSGSDDDTDGEKSKTSDADARKNATASYKKRSEKGSGAAKARRAEIEKHFADRDKQMEANDAFAAWQRRMEGLQIRAAKRNIVNSYVWDADGGTRSEEQSFANTIEHTIGGSFSVNASLGLDANVTVAGFKFELQAMGTFEMSQTMSKTASDTQSFDLNVRLDGVERKGVTDADDYPVIPGEKVDRYRFMSYYLEGDTDHFTDFFERVVDPEWLLSNDEEARALRQVGRGRANKAWRVMHRVTYVERPALMGFGRDLRPTDDLAQSSQEVFNYFDSLEQDNEALRTQIDDVSDQLAKLAATLAEVKQQTAAATTKSSGPPEIPTDASEPGATAAAIAASAAAGPATLDVNRATEDELARVNGIGLARAREIVHRRTTVGPFTSLRQLAEVAGITDEIVVTADPMLFIDEGLDTRNGTAVESTIDLRDGATTGLTNGAGLDINTATATQLEALPGIGPATAKAITDLRKVKGGFADLQQLTEVAGIGSVMLATLREHLVPIYHPSAAAPEAQR